MICMEKLLINMMGNKELNIKCTELQDSYNIMLEKEYQNRIKAWNKGNYDMKLIYFTKI